MTADLDGLPFTVVRRGFDRAQVEERFGRLLADRDAAYEARQSAIAEREHLSRELDVSRGETRAARAELAETRAEVDRLAAQVAELSTIPSTVDGMSDRLQQMVRVAQDEVNDMRARATRGAAQILGMAQAEADELRDTSRQERRAFEAEQRAAQEELRARLEESRTQLQQLREESDGQRARLDAELAERRSHDEQALAAEMADRREVMLADLAAQEKRQREEAQRIVDAASARARALAADAAVETDRARALTREQVARATEELEQLRALQHQVAEQLTGVRSLLDWTLPRINPAAVNGDGPAAPTVAVPVVAAETSPSIGVAPAQTALPDAAQLGAQGPLVPDLDAQQLDTPLFDTQSLETPVFEPREPEVLAPPVVPGTEPERDDEAQPELVAADATPARDVPAPRGGDQAESARPSPTARSGHRAGARR
jgi:hypothetical protein